jgi:hypothetical protein
MWFDSSSFILQDGDNNDDGGVLVVDRCRGLSKVWYGGEGGYLHGCGWFLLESAEDRFLGVDRHDNLCHHVSVMEQLAD